MPPCGCRRPPRVKPPEAHKRALAQLKEATTPRETSAALKRYIGTVLTYYDDERGHGVVAWEEVPFLQEYVESRQEPT